LAYKKPWKQAYISGFGCPDFYREEPVRLALRLWSARELPSSVALAVGARLRDTSPKRCFSLGRKFLLVGLERHENEIKMINGSKEDTVQARDRILLNQEFACMLFIINGLIGYGFFVA
jgi:hypothetical protein